MQELSIHTVRASKHPSLAKHARLQVDRLTGEPVLLSQEAIFTLNRTGYEILKRCDGTRTFTQLIEELVKQYPVSINTLPGDVLGYLHELTKKGLLQWN
jgi:pyrroloquinoline quinone biosynthesis protein D